MERNPVRGSSNVAAISPLVDGVFEIELNNGAVYRHKDVPKEVHDALMAAGSKGGYYFKHFRNKYGCEKV